MPKEFDDQLRAALEGLEAAPAGADWSALERRLDTELPVDFDAALRAGLDAPAPDGPTTESWLLLADRLHEAGLTEEDPFDALTRTGLRTVSPAAVPAADWDAFSELLDDAEPPAFDQRVQQHLDHYETPYDASTWPAMEERIVDTFSIRRRLLRYKVLEVAIMGLFLFTLVGQLRLRIDSLPVLLEQLVPGYEAEESPATPATPPAPIARTETPPPSTGTRQEAITGNRLPENSRTVATGLLPTAPLRAAGPPTAFTLEENTAADRRRPAALAQLDAVPDELTIAVPDVATPPVPAREKRGLLTALETLFPKKLDEQTQDLSDTDLLPGYRRRARLRLGMVGSFERNLVHTDPITFRLAREMNTDRTASFGYGGGFALDFNYGRFGLSTGILYAHRSYRPAHRGKRIVDGPFVYTERLARVSYETVQIPVLLRYDAVSRKDWRVYGIGGLAVNAVLSTAYDVEWQQTASIGGSPAGGATGPSRNEIQRQSTLLAVDFPDGGFGGDAFGDISYLTANLGFGIEKYIGTGWSLHLQPMYGHSLRSRGLGPLGERIHSWSLQAGAKVDLGKAARVTPVRAY